jgi:DNA-binding NarL/FixJ family response regulator
MTNSPDIKIAIVDDHLLFASSLAKLIQTFSGYKVVFHAKNGLDLQNQLKTVDSHPDIILLDINMPVMDGHETIVWLTEHHPEIKVLALSMDDNEEVILKMLRNGAKGYLLKDIHPEKLKEAMSEVLQRGYYHSEKVSMALLNSIGVDGKDDLPVFKENQIKLMKLSCSEMTYK